MNEQNLKPLNKRTKDEQRAIQQNGGIASGQARRRKKMLRELLQLMFETPSEKREYDSKAAELVGRAFINELENPNFDTIIKAQKILGEAVERHEITTAADFETLLDDRLKIAGYK